MLEHRSPSVAYGANVALGDAVLVMCSDAAVSDVLACVLYRGDEGTLGKSPVVGVVGRDADSVSVTQSFELDLCVHRLLGVR